MNMNNVEWDLSSGRVTEGVCIVGSSPTPYVTPVAEGKCQGITPKKKVTCVGMLYVNNDLLHTELHKYL